MGFLHPGYRIRTALRAFRGDAEFLQGLFHIFQNVFPVIHHKYPEIREIRIYGRHIINLHGNRHRKSRTRAVFARHTDSPSKQLHQPFGNSHSQPASFRLIHTAVLLPGKGLKNMLHEILAHAYTGICYHHIQKNGKLVLPFSLFDIHAHFSSGRSEFGCIGQKINQYLPQTQRIGAISFMPEIMKLHRKLLIPGLDIRLCDGNHISYQLRKGQGNPADRNISVFYFAHVQDIIDQPQQVPPRQGYFFKTVLYFIRLIQMQTCNIRHPHNRIHRRPYVMGHVGEEIRLGLVRPLRQMKRRLQLLRLLFQLLLHQAQLCLICNINKQEQINRGLSQGIHTGGIDLKPCFLSRPACHTHHKMHRFSFGKLLFMRIHHFFVLFEVLQK